MYVWKLNQDRIEFDRVLPVMLQTDPDGCYVIQRDDGTLLLRSGQRDNALPYLCA